jgi:hypothetical protein
MYSDTDIFVNPNPNNIKFIILDLNKKMLILKKKSISKASTVNRLNELKDKHYY